MEVIRAKTAGFCFGVKRAVDTVYEQLEKASESTMIYTCLLYTSYALFPQVAIDFFKYREAQQTKVDATVADTENGAYPV